MSSPKKSADELEAEMDALTGRLSSLSIELQEARRRRAHVPTNESLSEQEQYRALLRKMIGRRVLITVKGKHKGKQGVITRHAGDTFRPVNWYVHIGCITDDRQTHSATRTCLTNTPRDAEPF